MQKKSPHFLTRWWLWLTFAAITVLLLLLGIGGGKELGRRVLEGVNLREPSMAASSPLVVQPPMAVTNQATYLLGYSAKPVVPSSSVSALADMAAHGEVRIDDEGQIHDVKAEKEVEAFLAGHNTTQAELDALYQPSPSASAPLPDSAVGMATTNTSSNTPSKPREAHNSSHKPDIFFGI